MINYLYDQAIANAVVDEKTNKLGNTKFIDPSSLVFGTTTTKYQPDITGIDWEDDDAYELDEPCDECHGDGGDYDEFDDWVECEYCLGEGYISVN